VQPQQVDISTALAPPSTGLERLPPLERMRAPRPERTAQPGAAVDATSEAAAFDLPVLDGGPSAVITVRYALDPVARTWVAHLFDAHTGDLLRQVPSTEYHHQMAVLAALRQKSVDHRA
jgi:hypothetical protein